MGFDSVFNGDPTTANVTASGNASFGIDLASGKLYFRDNASAGWQPITVGGGAVTSDTVTNESAVTGATVTDALNTLNGGGSGGPLSFTATISAAQLLSLPTSPVLIGPVPAAGTYLFPVSFVVEYIAGATPYSVYGVTLALALSTFLTDGNQEWQSFSGAGFLDQSVNMVLGEAGAAGVPITAASLNENQLALAANGGTITAGNGTLKISVTYYVMTL